MFSKLLKNKKTATHTVQVMSHDVSVQVQPEETLLEALLDQGVDVPYNCQAGNCTECKCRLLEGKVHQLIDHAYVFTRDEIDQGYVLACQTKLRGDIKITYIEETDS